MRAKAKFLICALLTLGLLVPVANAQIVHTVTQGNEEVVQYGLNEVLGEVRLTVVSGTTIASTISITYSGVTIANLPTGYPVITSGKIEYPNGVTLTCTGGYSTSCDNQATKITGSNTAAGGQIIITVAGSLSPAANDLISINGVRADVSAKAVSATVGATIQSTPSNANLFNIVSVTVATVNGTMTAATTAVTTKNCVAATNPSIKISEGFAGSFVEHTSPTANARSRYGATLDTTVVLAVTGLPTGVTLSWPTTIVASAATASTATLVLAAGSTSAAATYGFNTTNQSSSDAVQESFTITPVVTVTLGSAFAQSTITADVGPAVATTFPGYGAPVTTAANFINNTKCVTYMLFPFVTCQKTTGFTTGIAIANTSKDDTAFGGLVTAGGEAQSGAITWYGYPSSTKTADGSSGTLGTVITTITSASLAAGDVSSVTCDAQTGFSAFEGYVIAKADFQFGHGFAFVLGKYNTGSTFDVAHGYLALVVPDPSVTARTTASGGESLGQ